jgi:HNH endonuclease
MRSDARPVRVICGYCGIDFLTREWRIRQGGGKFCSAACRAKGKPQNEPQPIEPRFWPKVRKTKTCWLWTGSKNNKGYGQLRVGGRKGSARSAHRIAWELANGPLVPGRCILHRCDTPACVRPDHLFEGSKADNTRDMVLKGRWSNQFRNHATESVSK